MLNTTLSFPEKMTATLLQLPRMLSKENHNPLISYSLPWPRVSLIAFLSQNANAPRIYWENESSETAFAGVDVAETLKASGLNRFHAIQEQADRLFKNLIVMNEEVPEGVGPRLAGGFSFWNSTTSAGVWSAFPAARFILPRYQLSYVKGQAWLTINHRLASSEDPTSVAWTLHEEIRKLRVAADQQPTGLNTSSRPAAIEDLTDKPAWCQLVSDATGRIKHGDFDKVVLARARRIQSTGSVDTVGALARLKQTYPGCYRFLFEPIPGHAFYGATPELLAELNDVSLRTVALAGSTPRGSTLAEDLRLGTQLMKSPKEQHEHALVVDAIRENLEPLVKRLKVDEPPRLLKLSNIQHLQTPINGELYQANGLLPVIEALHPTPALGGRPRQAALGHIRQVEPESRGWYGSPIGWLDSQGNGMFAVAIRSAVSVGNETMLYAGAGIVADSIPEREWQETQLKFKPLMDIFSGINRP